MKVFGNQPAISARRILSSLAHVVLAFGAFSLVHACKRKKPLDMAEAAVPDAGDNVRFIAKYPLAIKEPSGLTIAPDGRSLWSVSDQDGMVYRLTLEGGIIGKFPSGLKDPEGIMALDERRVAVVSERNSKLAIYDFAGKMLQNAIFDLPANTNNGAEGLGYNAADGNYYLLKENKLGLLLVLDGNLKEISRIPLKFARDYSDLVYDPVRQQFWIMSDQSRMIYVLDRTLKLRGTYSIDIQQMEGLAVDSPNHRIYIVSDATAELYVYDYSED